MISQSRIAPLAVLVIAGCIDRGAPPDSGDSAVDSGPPARNVVLLIADDIGVDVSGTYSDVYGGDLIPEYAPTPNIDAICEQGVRFTQAWSTPTCSPTRATILTGRYGFRNGIGWAITADETNDIGISLEQPTLPRVLSDFGVSSANIGKWHLGTTEALAGSSAPNTAGWPHFAGGLIGEVEDYESWSRTENGVTALTSTYTTTANVDDAIAWISQQDPDQPWVLWLAFNAPHTPFHLPPADLHSYDALSGVEEDIVQNPAPYYRAMVEAMDTEIGRLQGWMAEQGVDAEVIYLGDNGTDRDITPDDPDHAKGTLFQGSLHVPMCLQGDSVVEPGRDVSALVQTVDLYSTILELAGVDLDAALDPDFIYDTVSFAPYLADPAAEPIREWVYTEAFPFSEGFNGTAIRDAQYKLITVDDRSSMYDLTIDPLEAQNLMDHPLEKDVEARRAELAEIVDDLLDTI